MIDLLDAIIHHHHIFKNSTEPNGVPIETDTPDNFFPHVVISINKDTRAIFCQTLIGDGNDNVFRIGNNTGDHIVFDGLNNKNMGIVFIYREQSNSFTSYCLYKNRTMNIESRWASLCNSGYPISCVLDKKKDTFLLLTKDQNQHSIDICRINAQNCNFKSLTKLALNYSISKVASFGNNIYGMLTEDGQFKTVVYDADHNQLSVNNQQHGATRFKHIAVNSAYVNERNFRPRFALLTVPDVKNQAKLFVCDLREFEEPTLLLAHTVSDAHRVGSFYYKGSALRLMYHDATDPMRISCSTIFSDNFNVLLTKALINRNIHLLRKRSADDTPEDEPQRKRPCLEQHNIKKNNT